MPVVAARAAVDERSGTFAPSSDNRPVYEKRLPKVLNFENPTYGSSATGTGTVPDDPIYEQPPGGGDE